MMQKIDRLLPAGLNGMATLKAVFVGHFVLITFILFGQWVPLSYLWYNSLFLLSLIWSIICLQTQSSPSISSLGSIEHPMALAIFINIFAFFIDLLLMISAYSGSYAFANAGGWNGLSLVLCILNMLARLPSTFLLLRAKVHSNEDDQYAASSTLSSRSTHQANSGVRTGIYVHEDEYNYDVPPIYIHRKN